MVLQNIRSSLNQLTLSQKVTLGFFALILLALPVVSYIVSQRNTTNTRASGPVSPPMPPSNYYTALQLTNEGYNDTYMRAPGKMRLPNTFTIESWVRIPKPTSGNYIREFNIISLVKQQSPYDRGYLMRINAEVQESTGQARPFISVLTNSTSTVNSNYLTTGALNQISMNSNQWYHIAGVFTSSNGTCTLTMYINGAQATKDERFASCAVSPLEGDALEVGKPNQGAGGISGYYFHGVVDEVHFSSTARYAAPFTKLQKPEIADTNSLALYHFDKNTTDSSPAQRNGTITGIHASYIEGNTFPLPTMNPTSPTPTKKPSTLTPTPSRIPSKFPFTPTPTKRLPSGTPSPTVRGQAQSHPSIIKATPFKLGRVGINYTDTINVLDINRDDTITTTITGLPAGLTHKCTQSAVSSRKIVTCTISGVPTKKGAVQVTIRAVDNRGGEAAMRLPLTIQ